MRIFSILYLFLNKQKIQPVFFQTGYAYDNSENGRNGSGFPLCSPIIFSIHTILYHLPNLYPLLMKFSDHLIAHMSMKLDTVFRRIFVFLLRISDAGVKVEKMLLSGNPFDFLIKTSPDSAFSHGVLHIDGYFRRPA